MRFRTRFLWIEATLALLVLAIALWFMVPRFQDAQFRNRVESKLEQILSIRSPTKINKTIQVNTLLELHRKTENAEETISKKRKDSSHPSLPFIHHDPVQSPYDIIGFVFYWETEGALMFEGDPEPLSLPVPAVAVTQFNTVLDDHYTIAGVYLDPHETQEHRIDGGIKEFYFENEELHSNCLVTLYDPSNGLHSEGLIYVEKHETFTEANAPSPAN